MEEADGTARIYTKFSPRVVVLFTTVGSDISHATQKDLFAIRRRTGIVFQDPASSLNPRMPIGQSIGEPILLAGVARGRDLDKRVEELLGQVELPASYRNRFPHELSGGQRQRASLARACSSAASGRSR